MGRHIYNALRLNKHDNVNLGISYIVCTFFGVIVSAIAASFGNGDEYVPIGVVMAVTMTFFLPIIMSLSQFSMSFDIAVRAGSTRRGFLTGQLVANLLFAYGCAALLALTMLLEVFLSTAVFGASGFNLSVIGAVPIAVWAFVPAALVLFGLCLGVALSKMGKKAGFLFGAFYFLGLFGFLRVVNAMKAEAPGAVDRVVVSIVHFLLDLGAWAVLGTTALILVAISIICWRIMLKKAVN